MSKDLKEDFEAKVKEICESCYGKKDCACKDCRPMSKKCSGADCGRVYALSYFSLCKKIHDERAAENEKMLNSIKDEARDWINDNVFNGVDRSEDRAYKVMFTPYELFELIDDLVNHLDDFLSDQIED